MSDCLSFFDVVESRGVDELCARARVMEDEEFESKAFEVSAGIVEIERKRRTLDYVESKLRVAQSVIQRERKLRSISKFQAKVREMEADKRVPEFGVLAHAYWSTYVGLPWHIEHDKLDGSIKIVNAVASPGERVGTMVTMEVKPDGATVATETQTGRVVRFNLLTDYPANWFLFA